jgi:protein TonB
MDDIPDISTVTMSKSGLPGGGGGLISGVPTDLGTSDSAAPPPPPPPPKKKEPVRVGGSIQSSKLIRRVEPVYPDLAKRARVQGVVLLEVTVDETGNVSEINIIRGHPLLNQAAVDAVEQWKYSPTLLNGEPVPVKATVTVTFQLN